MRLTLLFVLTCALPIGQQASVAAGQGYVVGWGQNSAGQATGVPVLGWGGPPEPQYSDSAWATGLVTVADAPLSNAVAIAAGVAHSLALASDGSVAGWGAGGNGSVVGYEAASPTNGVILIGGRPLGDAVAVAAGMQFGLAVRKDGSVAAWGRNAIPNGLRDVIAVAANLTSCLALRRDGTVVQWNNPPGAGQPDPVEQSYLARFLPPAEISNVVAVAVGGEVEPRCLAVVKGGAVVPWWQEGAPPPDNMVPPPGLSNAVAVAAGAAHSLALTAGGAVWGWGHDGSGQLSGRAAVNVARDYSGPIVLGGQPLTNAVAISAARYSNMALKRDGTVVAWGRRDSYRDVPEGLSNVVAIAAGDNFCLAITTNRQVAARFMQPR